MTDPAPDPAPAEPTRDISAYRVTYRDVTSGLIQQGDGQWFVEGVPVSTAMQALRSVGAEWPDNPTWSSVDGAQNALVELTDALLEYRDRCRATAPGTG